MVDVVDFRNADDRRDVIHRACQLLTEGGLIAVPTETVYVVAASAASVKGVESLRQLAPAARRTLLVKSEDEARDYLPNFPVVAHKLAKRCWPGPLTMAFPVNMTGGLFRGLPETVRTLAVDGDQHVSIRTSGHLVLAAIQSLLPVPLLAMHDSAGLRSPADAVSAFGDSVELIIDDGPCRYGEPSTVVQIRDGFWKILEPGVVTETILKRLASEVYLFVCTGNTCRSPMAEALFRHHLARRLGCSDDELEARGHLVISAGLSAANGSPASPEAVELLADERIDLSSHESQLLTERLLNYVDHVYTMTRQHRAAILSQRPDLDQTVSLLSAERSDISDPIGGGRDEYAACKEEIERSVISVLDRLFPSTSSAL